MPMLIITGTDQRETLVPYDIQIDDGRALGEHIWRQQDAIPGYRPGERYMIFCAGNYYDITGTGYDILDPEHV